MQAFHIQLCFSVNAYLRGEMRKKYIIFANKKSDKKIYRIFLSPVYSHFSFIKFFKILFCRGDHKLNSV